MHTVIADAAHSRFVQRIRRRHAAELALLPPGAPDSAAITALVLQLQAAGRDLAGAMRVARNLVLERLAVLDVEERAPLDVVTGTMTALAEATLELALAQAQAEADERHGPPLGAAGRRHEMWIVGMGKLGARELNVSSDIDLIYVYEEGDDGDGHTAGPRPTSFQEYFTFVAKRLYALIGETTDDGFVFRVDLMLRPNGSSGPPVVSLGMLEDYLQVQGREWERFAWLKSRVVAPRAASFFSALSVLRVRISGKLPPRTTCISCTVNSISRMPPRDSFTSLARSGRPAARRCASSRILRCSWRRPSNTA